MIIPFMYDIHAIWYVFKPNFFMILSSCFLCHLIMTKNFTSNLTNINCMIVILSMYNSRLFL